MSAITIDLDNDLFVVSTGMMRQCLLSTPTLELVLVTTMDITRSSNE